MSEPIIVELRDEEDEPKEDITVHNLTMLEREMEDLLLSESFGGNAGKVEIDNQVYPCAAANGFADPLTGRIFGFTNYDAQKVGASENDVRFTLLVALDIDFGTQQQPRMPRGFFKIVRLSADDGLSEVAKSNMNIAIDQYNKNREV